MIHTVTLNPSLDHTLHYGRLAPGEVSRVSSVRVDVKRIASRITLRRLA